MALRFSLNYKTIKSSVAMHFNFSVALSSSNLIFDAISKLMALRIVTSTVASQRR